MFGADAGIVETCRNRMCFGDLTVIVLKQIGFVAVQDAGAATRKARGMFLVQPVPCRLDAEHCDICIVEEGMEQA